MVTNTHALFSRLANGGSVASHGEASDLMDSSITADTFHQGLRGLEVFDLVYLLGKCDHSLTPRPVIAKTRTVVG